MKAKEFEEKFEQNDEDIVDDLDLRTAKRINQDEKE